MANRYSDTLFQLIHSLEKAEKRHFKLYIKRSSGKEDLKVVQLFDALDKMEEYDERVLFRKIPSLTKPQLANLKTHLYGEVLSSLRLLRTSDNIDLQLSEHLDHARLLYNKGLKLQALRILEKAKEQARAHQKFNTLVQLLSLEKKIEILHITRSSTEKTQELADEATAISKHIDRVTCLSNLALLLYRWYVIHGHARNVEDEKDIRAYFKANLPKDLEQVAGFYEQLYLYQSYCWYAFIRQDFLMYYRYAQKWVDLFETDPLLKSVETGHYIKGVHALLNAHFDLRNFEKFDETLAAFEEFAQTDVANRYDNFRTHISIYINSARVNGHLMKGTFAEGVKLVQEIEEKLSEYALYVDQHRILVFNYKIASLYFGNRQYEKAIDYLQEIINGPIDLRIDLHSYARLMHLLCHYELGNYDILDSLAKAVHRFMVRMKNLTVVEEIMFRFLRKNYRGPQEIREGLKEFLAQIKGLEKNRFETRAFAYLDIVSWVESKVHNKTLNEVIGAKYRKSKRR
ncbi:MAG TPA: hypothetical protein PKE63_00590 [Lacibacter sp.]|nr:hypothetical protein [Lacibacter sp.]HMO90074.1 hypothetical protein [Lacibacter sp.]HMP85739.1 hypothetical protein [Lacibacter sp.]